MKAHSILIRLLLLPVLFGLCSTPATVTKGAVGIQISHDGPSVDDVSPKTKKARDSGLVLFLFGAFCALWAQNTGRNAWLWFFLGLLFSVIAVIVLLNKNATDNFDRKVYGRTTRDLRP